jgi:hypothetical protein
MPLRYAVGSGTRVSPSNTLYVFCFVEGLLAVAIHGVHEDAIPYPQGRIAGLLHTVTHLDL